MLPNIRKLFIEYGNYTDKVLVKYRLKLGVRCLIYYDTRMVLLYYFYGFINWCILYHAI